MAVTGIIGVLFVLLHATGNLLAIRGPSAINGYSHFLKSTGELLWLIRIILILAVMLHVTAAAQLTLQSKRARPLGYEMRDPQVSTFAARMMRWGGALLLVFIVLHILHFTTGTIRPAGYFDPANVYGNIVTSFRIWWVTLFYLIAMISLGLHLFHGVWSSPRSLGLAQPKPNPLRRTLAILIAVYVWLAFTLVPVAVFAGLLR